MVSPNRWLGDHEALSAYRRQREEAEAQLAEYELELSALLEAQLFAREVLPVIRKA